MDPVPALVPIFMIAMSMLSKLAYRAGMLSKDKTVEIHLWSSDGMIHTIVCEGGTRMSCSAW